MPSQFQPIVSSLQCFAAPGAAGVVGLDVDTMQRMIEQGQFPRPFKLCDGEDGRPQLRWTRGMLMRWRERKQWTTSRVKTPSAGGPLLSDLPGQLRRQLVEYQPFKIIRECVYFLFDEQQLIYIGSSNSLHVRLATHFWNGNQRSVDAGQRKKFDQVLYLPVAPAEMLAVEATLIRRFLPPLNSTACLSLVEQPVAASFIGKFCGEESRCP
jgi:predicted DNA-binding transcriptional regulator AlpA